MPLDVCCKFRDSHNPPGAFTKTISFPLPERLPFNSKTLWRLLKKSVLYNFMLQTWAFSSKTLHKHKTLK